MTEVDINLHSDYHQKIDDSIMRAKNFPPLKSVEMVLSVCEDILCQPLEELSAAEKELLLGVLGRYTVMKRQLANTEIPAKVKQKNEIRPNCKFFLFSTQFL